MLHPGGDKRSRGRARDFLTFARSADDGIDYTNSKSRLDCSPHQAETRKSLFEEMGLLYVPHRSNKIIVTPLGRQLHALLDGVDLENISDDLDRKSSAILIWALTRVQINRPQSRGVPAPALDEWQTCDLRPYAAAWHAIKELGGTIRIHEFLGALSRTHRADQVESCISAIQHARKAGTQLSDQKQWMRNGASMNYVIYWRSHLSLAEKLLSFDNEEQALRRSGTVWEIVEAAIRFQSGCDGSPQNAFTAQAWSSAEEYFEGIVGTECPAYLAGGAPVIRAIDGHSVADLRAYEIVGSGHAVKLRGGSELCSLPLKLACYHPAMPSRLLRLDNKISVAGGVELQFALGRPISNSAILEQAFGKADV